MLFKKIAIAAAVATTLAFVGCSKEKAPANVDAAASSAVEAASDVQAASDAATVEVASQPATNDVAASAADNAPVDQPEASK